MHFFCNKVFQKELDIQFVPLVDQVAYLFTKSLSITQFLKLKAKLKVNESLFCLRGPVKTILLEPN